jgi:hypothetical protein
MSEGAIEVQRAERDQGTLRVQSRRVGKLASVAMIVTGAACGVPLSADMVVSLQESCLVAVPSKQPISGASIGDDGAMRLVQGAASMCRFSTRLWAAVRAYGPTQVRHRSRDLGFLQGNRQAKHGARLAK